MSWWVWLLLGFFLLLAEMLTPGGFYLLFFGAGALVVGLLAGLNAAGPLWLQWLLFTVFSIVALLLFRRPLLEKFGRTPAKEVDTLVGETAVVLQDIASGGIGKVELRGTAWSAHNAGAAVLRAGERCTVVNVNGLTLQVRS